MIPKGIPRLLRVIQGKSGKTQTTLGDSRRYSLTTPGDSRLVWQNTDYSGWFPKVFPDYSGWFKATLAKHRLLWVIPEGIPRLLRLILGKSVKTQTCRESPGVVWEYLCVALFTEYGGVCCVKLEWVYRPRPVAFCGDEYCILLTMGLLNSSSSLSMSTLLLNLVSSLHWYFVGYYQIPGGFVIFCRILAA